MNIVRTRMIRVGQEVIYNYKTFQGKPYYTPRIYLARQESETGLIDVIDESNIKSSFNQKEKSLEHERKFIFKIPATSYFVIRNHYDRLGNSTKVEVDKIIVTP